MNKQELINAMSLSNGLPKTINAYVLDSFMGESKKELKKGGEIRLTNFFTLSVSKRPATMCRNPATGAKIKVPAHNQPRFKAGKALKLAVNK